MQLLVTVVSGLCGASSDPSRVYSNWPSNILSCFAALLPCVAQVQPRQSHWPRHCGNTCSLLCCCRLIVHVGAGSWLQPCCCCWRRDEPDHKPLGGPELLPCAMLSVGKIASVSIFSAIMKRKETRKSRRKGGGCVLAALDGRKVTVCWRPWTEGR